MGNITGKPKKLVKKCFEKIGKIGHFGKSGHPKNLYNDPISIIYNFSHRKALVE